MIEYEEDWFLRLLCAKEGSVVPKGMYWATPSVLIAIALLYMDEFLPGVKEDYGLNQTDKSQLWSGMFTCIVFLLSFRSRLAFSRFWEGTGLLHQMRGEWFDTVSNCVTFSIAAKPSKPLEVMAFRHAIIRIMSLCHGSALEEISGNGIELESIDTFGLDHATLKHLQECHLVYNFNQVEVMLHLLQSLITKALHDGVLMIPPPIASRVYQTISRGFVNLLNAKKIQDTKFPFPYAQLISFLMAVLSFLTPLMVTNVCQSKIIAVLFTFFPMFGLYCLNFVAMELENPFGTDDNDLPLEHFQTEMNNCLMMLLHPNTDLIATVSDACEMDFYKLHSQFVMTPEEAEKQEEEKQLAAEQAAGRVMAADVDGEEKGLTGIRKPLRKKSRRLSEFVLDSSPSDFSVATRNAHSNNQASDPPSPPAELAGGDQSTTARGAGLTGVRINDSQTTTNIVPTGTGSQSVSVTQPGPRPVLKTAGTTTSAKGFDEARIQMEIENLSMSVGREPLSSERQAARTQEPLSMLDVGRIVGDIDSSPKGGSTKGGSTPKSGGMMSAPPVDDFVDWEMGNSSVSRIADLQPVLSQNMDELIKTLEEWTTSVYREVDALNTNSAVLQKALIKFNQDLPNLRAEVTNDRSKSR